MSRLVRAIALITVIAVVAACSGPSPSGGGATGSPGAAAKPQYGGSIVFALEDDPIDFDPLRSRAFIDRNVHYQIYDSLVRIDETGKIIPWLAEKWDIPADGKTVTFTLRTDVKYHDGSAFDAASVKWNIDRYRTAQGSARSGELAPVESVEVVDSKTVKFNLKTPFSPLLSLLVDRAGMMVSQKAAEAGGQDFTRKAFKAGTGPFMLTEAVKDDHITLEKNPAYWGKDKNGNGLPFLDKITIKPIRSSDVRFTNLRTGDAQVANNIAGKDIPTIKGESGLNYQEKPAYSFRSLIPNRAKGFVFEEAKYVKAVSTAIDRKELLEKGYFNLGVAGYSTIAPNHFAFDASFKPFEKADPEAAKKLVSDVGKGPLTFTLLVSSGDPVILQIAQLIQAQLKKADITANIQQLEFAQILDQQSKKTFKDLSFVGWSGRVDPDGNTYDHIYSGRPFNDSSYSNKQVDSLLDQARQTPDEAKRRDLYRQAEKIYVQDDPARIWLGYGAAQLATSKKVVAPPVYPDQIVRFQFMSMAK
ncbi:MAG TPA: ABC transporter substrate-binding protein [Candidatus Limnocylindria bacterium]|nr:ABC transporter substrate-binding protein [Candidatus Limnocylindria bacterium]